ncbi:MAG: geranylgeranyl reductase family protein [Carboxydocellales bacterium]
MAKWETDILVVGAGPAGSIAAREAAAGGARVVLIERKSAVGIPVQCAEYVPATVGEFTGALRGSVVQRVKGIRTFVQQHEAAYTKAPGYILERSVFDQNLAWEARNQGANLLLNTVLLKKSPHGEVLYQQFQKQEIVPKIIIGGDGPRSLIAGRINHSGSVLAVAAQYTMELTAELADVEIYLDAVFPGGYAWLFPKGQFCNLGAAVDRRFGVKVLPALHYFLGNILKTGKLRSPKPVKKTGGFIPISGPLPKTQKDNILLVGDAGGFTHPITGGGILHALITGQLAGKIAAQALKEDDLTLLEQYEENWQAILGDTLERGAAKRDYLTEQWQGFGRKDFQLLSRRGWIAFPEYFQG